MTKLSCLTFFTEQHCQPKCNFSHSFMKFAPWYGDLFDINCDWVFLNSWIMIQYREGHQYNHCYIMYNITIANRIHLWLWIRSCASTMNINYIVQSNNNAKLIVISAMLYLSFSNLVLLIQLPSGTGTPWKLKVRRFTVRQISMFTVRQIFMFKNFTESLF